MASLIHGTRKRGLEKQLRSMAVLVTRMRMVVVTVVFVTDSLLLPDREGARAGHETGPSREDYKVR